MRRLHSASRAECIKPSDIHRTCPSPTWDRLYMGYSPLIGLERLTAYLPQAAQLHRFVALQSSDDEVRGPQWTSLTDSTLSFFSCHKLLWILDFVPLEATSVRTALTLASGRPAPGQIRSKRRSGRLFGSRTITIRRAPPPQV